MNVLWAKLRQAWRAYLRLVRGDDVDRTDWTDAEHAEEDHPII